MHTAQQGLSCQAEFMLCVCVSVCECAQCSLLPQQCVPSWPKGLCTHHLPSLQPPPPHINVYRCAQILRRIKSRELAMGLDAFKFNVVWQGMKRAADGHFRQKKGRQVCTESHSLSVCVHVRACVRGWA